MKKVTAVLVALAAVACLVLSGCNPNPNLSVANRAKLQHHVDVAQETYDGVNRGITNNSATKPLSFVLLSARSAPTSSHAVFGIANPVIAHAQAVIAWMQENGREPGIGYGQPNTGHESYNFSMQLIWC